jgi:hypothetical protein
VDRQMVKSYLPVVIMMREDRYRSVMSLVLFRLAASPIQAGVVGPYLIWGTWFPSHFLLEGTGCI